MGPVTLIAAVAVVVLAVPAVAVPAAVPDVAVPAAAVPDVAVPAAVEVVVAVAGWMCLQCMHTQEADVGRWIEAEPAGQAGLASAHAQQAEL